MRSRWLVLLLILTSVAIAQSPQPVQGPTPLLPKPESAQVQPGSAPAAPATKTANPAAIPDNSAVITIDGVCDPEKSDKASTAPCRTEITKAEFERLMNAITPTGAPPAAPTMQRQAAEKFAELLAFAAAAEKDGIQNTPQTQEMLRIARLQTLANGYLRHIQQTSKPTDAEIEAYYRANEDKFQKATLKQVFVPPLKTPLTPAEKKTEPAAAPKPEAKPANKEATEKARAEKLRERAVAGEPVDKLQKEAIEGTSYQAAPPSDLTLQRESTAPQRQSLFSLKEGEVSPVISEPSGLIFFKLISKTTVPLTEVKESISQRLTQEKFKSALDAIRNSSKPVLNEAYFGPTSPTPVLGGERPMPVGPGPGPRPGPRPAPQPQPAPTLQPK